MPFHVALLRTIRYLFLIDLKRALATLEVSRHKTRNLIALSCAMLFSYGFFTWSDNYFSSTISSHDNFYNDDPTLRVLDLIPHNYIQYNKSTWSMLWRPQKYPGTKTPNLIALRLHTCAMFFSCDPSPDDLISISHRQLLQWWPLHATMMILR